MRYFKLVQTIAIPIFDSDGKVNDFFSIVADAIEFTNHSFSRGEDTTLKGQTLEPIPCATFQIWEPVN